MIQDEAIKRTGKTGRLDALPPEPVKTAPATPVQKKTTEEPQNVEANRAAPAKKNARAVLDAFRASLAANILFSLLVPFITLLTTEWIARGTLAINNQGNGFVQAFFLHFFSFFFAWLLLVMLYVFISQLSGLHALATVVVGLLGNIPAVVTYYKLTMRGEPFLPWDLSQIDDLMSVKGSVTLVIQPSMIITLVLFVLLAVLAAFVRTPRKEDGKRDIKSRMILSATSLACVFLLLFGIFLSPAGSSGIGISQDMWMQDRYYRTNGVITGFLTNLQMLRITQPEEYSDAAAHLLYDQADQAYTGPGYVAGAAGAGLYTAAQQPDIIYLMGESFWDVTTLPGITYDQDLLPNLTRLKEEAAFGWGYSPSFGGGTCDVEFEALTGFSMEHLPAGSKPFQQYVTDDMFSLPQYLKSQGYGTVAIHGYKGYCWSRETAYPRLGIDEFISSEDFVHPSRRRGFISDDAMVDRIIEEYETYTADGTPAFIHAVSMQNHTTYSRDRYPADELVRVTEHPAGLPDSTIGQLEDCATGIREMDAAVGRLTDYLRTTDRPTILVFWGDHLNPMSDGYTLFEKTGFIEEGETASPNLHKVPLLIWSNYSSRKVDLGVLATYNISPVMMDLYDLDMPVMFQFLSEQLGILRGRSRGVTVQPDGSFSYDMTEAQQTAFNNHGILQYNYMFGDDVLESYLPNTA